MTKKELLEAIEDVADDTDILIQVDYEIRSISRISSCTWKSDKEEQCAIITPCP